MVPFITDVKLGNFQIFRSWVNWVCRLIDLKGKCLKIVEILGVWIFLETILLVQIQ